MENKQENEFSITRTFDAPREVIFKMFTDPEHLAHWWGPKGFGITVKQLDLRPGGVFHYAMRSPDGHEMWGKFVYREIMPPERIVFVNCFSDPDGNITPAPMIKVWPLEILNVLTLTEANGKTTLSLRGGPIHATAEERRSFREQFPSMQQGFGGTFDQLDAYLQKVTTH